MPDHRPAAGVGQGVTRMLTWGGVIVVILVAAPAVALYTPDRPRAGLEAAFLRAPGDLRDIAGTRLHLRDDGLTGAYRVIRYDLPDAVLSGPDPTGDYSDDRGVAQLLAVLDHLGVDRTTLTGNSIGGRRAAGGGPGALPLPIRTGWIG